jgi:small-conductance mechanosensitive channel
MTESDWVEMYGMAFSASATYFTVLISIVSGYLVIAYFVGERLTRTQVSIMNTMYLAVATTTISGSYVALRDFMFARNEMASEIPEFAVYGVVAKIYFWPFFNMILHSFMVLASLIFMWQVRPPRET